MGAPNGRTFLQSVTCARLVSTVTVPLGNERRPFEGLSLTAHCTATTAANSTARADKNTLVRRPLAIFLDDRFGHTARRIRIDMPCARGVQRDHLRRHEPRERVVRIVDGRTQTGHILDRTRSDRIS